MTSSKKKIQRKKFFYIFIFFVIFIIILVISFSKSKLKMSDFEKIAVYGYLENYLDLNKLYNISGKLEYNDLQITQSKIKEILDNHYANNETTISTNTILSELQGDISIDFRSIVISDYEYLESKDAFIRKDGINSGIANSESKIQNENSNKSLSITNIKKSSKNSYKIHFNVVDKFENSNVLETGIATIKVENNAFTLEDCKFDK